MQIKWPRISLFKLQPVSLTGIYMCQQAGETMTSHQEVFAHKNRGLRGDRYHNQKGYWDPVEGCQVTLISEHDLKLARKGNHLQFNNGQHRRNLVVEGCKTKFLKGKNFQIGEAIFSFQKPRPPCGYLNKIEGRGMAKALSYNSGICLQVIQSGKLAVGDRLIILET